MVLTGKSSDYVAEPTKSGHQAPGFAEIVNAYIADKVMPADALGDAAHLAMASLHAIDFILTWNCRHLANANKVRHIQSINRKLGLTTPISATPFEIIPE